MIGHNRNKQKSLFLLNGTNDYYLLNTNYVADTVWALYYLIDSSLSFNKYCSSYRHNYYIYFIER